MNEETSRDKPFVPQIRYTISLSDFVLVMMKGSLGTYGLSLGYYFGCGIVLGIIICIVIGFISYYGMLLHLKCAAHCKCGSLNEICEKAIGPKSGIFVSIVSIYAMVTIIMTYLKQIVQLTQSLLYQLVPGIPFYIVSPYFIFMMILLLYFIPTNVSLSFKVITFQSKMGILMILLLVIHTIYWFVHFTITDGLINLEDVQLFAFNTRTIECVSSFTKAFVFAPFVYPGFRHMEIPTYNRWKKGLIWAHSMMVIIYIIIGVFSYLTFPHINEPTLILYEYPQESIIVSVAYAAMILMLLFTTILRLDPAKYLLFGMISNKIQPTHFYFVGGGVGIIFLSFMISLWRNKVTAIIPVVLDICAVCLVMIFPPVLYIKIRPPDHFIIMIGAVFTLAVGILAIIGIVLMDIYPLALSLSGQLE